MFQYAARRIAVRSREKEVRQEFRELAFRMMVIAENLEELQSGEQPLPEGRQNKSSPAQHQPYSPKVLASFAAKMYRSRRQRDRLLPPSFFADPAWDMLLELFISKVEQKRISVTSLTIAAACPATTALRYLNLLEKTGFAFREDCELDLRVKYISLSDHGYWSMYRTLETQIRIIQGHEQPKPQGGDHHPDSGDYLIEESKRGLLRAVK